MDKDAVVSLNRAASRFSVRVSGLQLSSHSERRAEEGVMTKHRIYTMSFASVYPHYVAKAEKKGRTRTEVNEIIPG